jgi:hypothetical protein
MVSPGKPLGVVPGGVMVAGEDETGSGFQEFRCPAGPASGGALARTVAAGRPAAANKETAVRSIARDMRYGMDTSWLGFLLLGDVLFLATPS